MERRSQPVSVFEMNARPPLNFGGRLVVALVFVFGVTVCVWLGWYAGAISGLNRAAPILTGTTAPGPGLAPNIAPALDGVLVIGAGALLGIIAGLVGGIIVMLFFCRFGVLPAVRRSPRLTQQAEPPEDLETP